jgi:hypothetical protein
MAQLLLFAAGAVFIAKAKRSAEFGIIYCTIAATIVLHTLAGASMFHWTASIGELRYIAVVGPLFGIISVYGFSELLDQFPSPNKRLLFSLLVLAAVVVPCTTAVHPHRWVNYESVLIRLTNEIRAEHPDLTILSNHTAVAYTMDVAPSGGAHYAPLNAKTLKQYPDGVILWDPFSSNSIFFQTEVTKEQLLQDPTIHLLERYTYWGAEYLVLQKQSEHPPASAIPH